MTLTKYRIKIINETIIDDVALSEAEQLANMLIDRNAMATFLGNLTFTYSEIERLD